MTLRNNDFLNTGYITASDEETLYLSIQGKTNNSQGVTTFGVYRITGANNNNVRSSDVDDITEYFSDEGTAPIRRPGPLVIGPEGHLWLTEHQSSNNGVEAALYRMKNPRNAATFTKLDIDRYSGAVVSPSGIDVAEGEAVYISQNGKVIAKIPLGPLQ